MKTFRQNFKDRIDMYFGTVCIDDVQYRYIQADVLREVKKMLDFDLPGGVSELKIY